MGVSLGGSISGILKVVWELELQQNLAHKQGDGRPPSRPTSRLKGHPGSLESRVQDGQNPV